MVFVQLKHVAWVMAQMATEDHRRSKMLETNPETETMWNSISFTHEAAQWSCLRFMCHLDIMLVMFLRRHDPNHLLAAAAHDATIVPRSVKRTKKIVLKNRGRRKRKAHTHTHTRTLLCPPTPPPPNPKVTDTIQAHGQQQTQKRHAKNISFLAHRKKKERGVLSTV